MSLLSIAVRRARWVFVAWMAGPSRPSTSPRAHDRPQRTDRTFTTVRAQGIRASRRTPSMLHIAALGGVIGPAAFIGAWTVGAAVTTREYSSTDDTISRLAAIGADTRLLMTAGFISFGLALPFYGVALRTAVGGRAWMTAIATGVAILGVAATPLEHSSAVDTGHVICAGFGYLMLAATPLLAVRPLQEHGHRVLAGFGVVAGTVSAVSLTLSTTDLPPGLFQRIGLTATHVWIATSALAIACGRLHPTPG